jgi:hypothetical protein
VRGGGNMAERVCVGAVCQNSEAFWCCDVIIGGIYRVDKSTGKIRCVVSPVQMYREGYFFVRKLLYWQDKIFILPTEFNRKWIVYCIASERISFCHPITFQYFSEETIIKESKGFCIPFFSDKPVLILDLDTMQCIDKLDIKCAGEESGIYFEIWNAFTLEDEICFLLKNSTCLCRINGRDIKTIILDIPKKAGCMDFYRNEGWVLAADGTNLYKVDVNGKCIDKIPMKINKEFVRLAATQRYVFLLPRKGSGIYVYDQYIQGFQFINAGRKEIKHLLPEPLYAGSYWDYIIDGSKIQFLQCKYPQLVVDLETLEYEQKEFCYSEKFSKEKYWNYYWRIQKMYGKIFKEPEADSLKGFLKMVIYSEKEKKQGVAVELKIWEYLN